MLFVVVLEIVRIRFPTLSSPLPTVLSSTFLNFCVGDGDIVRKIIEFILCLQCERRKLYGPGATPPRVVRPPLCLASLVVDLSAPKGRSPGHRPHLHLLRLEINVLLNAFIFFILFLTV